MHHYLSWHFNITIASIFLKTRWLYLFEHLHLDQNQMKSNPCRILFVCTGNAGRSQIAAALCEQMATAVPQGLLVRSAGVEPWDNLHPMAVKLLGERDISVIGRYPKPVSAVLDKVNDIVVTIGDPARSKLPRPIPGVPVVIHWDIADPADADGTSESLSVFRHTMEKLESRLPELLAAARELAGLRRVNHRPGVTTGVWYPDRFEPALHLPQAVAGGFTAIEFNCFLGDKHFKYRNKAAVRELKKVADDLGIEIWSIHEPSNVACVGSIDSIVRQSALDDLKLSIELAVELGASTIPSHALVHNAYKKPTDASRDIAIGSLNQLVPDLGAAGVRIAIENGYPDTQKTLDAFALLPAESFGFVLDTGHANISGGNDNISHIIQTVGKRMISLHLNDNDAKQDSHYPPGDATCTIDWPAVANQLKYINYQGCYLWEVFSRLGGRTDTPVDVMTRTIKESGQLFGR